jgi:hypothetical protein
MGNKKNTDIRIVRGEDRFANSNNTDMQLKIDLKNSKKNYVEGDRTVLLNLEERFNDERQSSTKFRVSGKLTNITNNQITGFTQYEPFINNLYYVNQETIVEDNGIWKGYPQYDEFSFIRTSGITGHVPFETKKYDKYNWMVLLSYVYENDYRQILKYVHESDNGNITTNYSVSEGIPYLIKNTNFNGKNLITFYCGYNHNLNIGEWIEFDYEVNGNKYFQVYSIGDKSYGNENRIFSIFNLGYVSPHFNDDSHGTFKRVIDINNITETTSKYYVRKHKVLTDSKDVSLNYLGFENIPFPNKKKIEYADLTPNNVERVAIKDGTRTVSFSFNQDLDINGLRDNWGRPITELFVTIVNKGYMGWFNNPYGNNSAIQIGWEFNFLNNSISNWWNINNNINNTDNIPYNVLFANANTFYYNRDINKDHILKGDICEYNEYEMKENVLSKMVHKFSFNQNIFYTNDDINLPFGYTYQPHYSIKTKGISDYVETGEQTYEDLVPDYSFYSNYDLQWRWRDIYEYGYIDGEGEGTDFPFLNGAHYPFKQITFLQTPMYRNNNIFNNIVYPPISDGCE